MAFLFHYRSDFYAFHRTQTHACYLHHFVILLLAVIMIVVVPNQAIGHSIGLRNKQRQAVKNSPTHIQQKLQLGTTRLNHTASIAAIFEPISTPVSVEPLVKAAIAHEDKCLENGADDSEGLGVCSRLLSPLPDSEKTPWTVPELVEDNFTILVWDGR